MAPSVFAALVTPFASSTGEVALDLIPPHLRWLEANGLDGVVPCGTTGEGPSLSLSERKAVIDTVLANRGQLRVIPGTGCVALPETIEATRYALERGAEAALVLPPFFFKGVSDAGLLTFYRAVCDALPAGGKIVLYHIPPVSQIAITTGVLDGLMDSHPDAIYGLKDSGGDGANTAMLIARYPTLQIFTGGAPLFAQALKDGAAGGIFALGNVFPRELRAISDAHGAGKATDDAQGVIRAFNEAIKPATPIPALKALLPHVADLPVATVRAPLVDLAPTDAQALWERVQQVA